MHFNLRTLASAAIAAASLAPAAADTDGAAAYPSPIAVTDANLLHRFPSGTWTENLVQRPNGKLLVTLISPQPQVYQIDPSKRGAAQLITTFPSPAKAATGIAELDPPDTYAVSSLGLDLSNGISIVNGTNQVWKLVFAKPSSLNATVSLAANVTNATLLNGMAALPWDRRIILSADSEAGSLIATDTRTGKYKTVQNETQLKDEPNDPNAQAGIGVNGLKVSTQGPANNNVKGAKGYVFFTNSAAASFNSVPVSADGSIFPGAKVSSIPLNTSFADDFALVNNGVSSYGGAFVATWSDHRIIRVLPNGGHYVAFTFPTTENGNNATSGPVAGWFDRWNSSVLYVSTGAGDLYKLNVAKFL